MLLAVERVALLRRVEVFARTPTRVLAGLAHVLEEVEYAAGTVLMRAGATEDWLFVLVDGEVEVVKADRVLSLTAPTVVGEMAVLDPEPRSATVRAATTVSGFRLGRAEFEEAVRRSPDIALGVIVELVRRLRRS
jgi:CRP-like cAMP-binding protein